jgi:hypothetical protein
VRAQQIPEAEAIVKALTDADHGCTAINRQCVAVATQLSTYAAKVDEVHTAILDLLARICDPLTGLKEVWDFLTDEDEDEIKKIASDIRVVVNNFTAEVDALRQQIATLLSEASTVVTTMGGYAAREWDQFLHGTEVGRVLNQAGQFGKGFGEEVGGLVKDIWTYGPVRAAIDPAGSDQSWNQLVDGMAPLVGLGGEHAPGVGETWKDLGKEVTHWDEWKTNPAEAAGKSTFDIATLFAPGGIAGAAGKSGRAAADAAEAAAQAGRGETAASRAFGDAAKSAVEPGAPAAAVPHAPRVETPPAERSPSPRKLTSAPVDGQLPHGPTESKKPVVEKLRTDDLPAVRVESSPRAHEPPIGPREPTPVGDHPVPAMPGGANEPAPVFAREPSAPASAVPDENLPSPDTQLGSPPRMLITADHQPAPPTVASAHSPQPAPMSLPDEPIPDSYPVRAHSPEPLLPHESGGTGGGGDGHGGGIGDGQDRGASRSGNHTSVSGSGHDSHQSGDSSSTDISATGLTDEKRDEIVAMEKGTRPDPSEYLSQEYIQDHLEQFDQGGTRFMLKDTFEDFGIGQIDGTTFVFPSSEIDILMESTKGEPTALEKALGIPDGYFKDNVIRVDIRDLGNYSLRIPSGNEAGANVKWLPGGMLPKGMPEAVIDGSKVPLECLTVDDLPGAERK